MAKKRSSRTVTADDGTQVRTTVITQNGDIVQDDRNGVEIRDADGYVLAIVPMSPQAMRNQARWMGDVAAA